MNYQAAVRYLLSLGRELAAPTQAAAAKFDLGNITILAERLGRPDRAYPSAHIAGTNGKGSTAAFLESILRRSGFRTGLNTSPHLEKINERIRVSGEEISDQAFAEAFTRIQALNEELLAAGKLRAHPTYFECVTAMAFEYFASERVDFGVFEVGLGGRLDATNILTPVVSVITRVDFDHESFLGHSLAEIAMEKAGILKPGVPLILSEQRPEALEVIRARHRTWLRGHRNRSGVPHRKGMDGKRMQPCQRHRKCIRLVVYALSAASRKIPNTKQPQRRRRRALSSKARLSYF
jgi:dihydrofolate synthase/folylpolyglutamate synthase